MANPREREIEEDPQDDEKVSDTTTLLNEEDDEPEVSPPLPRRKESVAYDDESEDDEDERLAHSKDDDEDDTPSSRRRRRNRSRKLRAVADQSTISVLMQQVEEMQSRLMQQERGQLVLAAQDVDSQIAQLESHLHTIDTSMASAIADGNKDVIAQARALEREAGARIDALRNHRARIENAARAAATPPAPMSVRTQQPSPVAARLSREFLADNPWFDPAGTDEASEIVKAIDRALTNEGYAHDSNDFWDELRDRVEARGLGDENMDEDEGEQEVSRKRDTPRRQARRNSGGLPPRSGRVGAGRPSGGSGDFKLIPQMTESLDALGLLDVKALDKDQLARRKNLVSTWRKGMEEARKAGKL